jgi:anti-sigma regulatory factor (Ser/Thr protein kinase)
VEGARFVIRDQGQGFQPLSRERQRLISVFERGEYRGLTLMNSLVDQVTFNARGNEVTLTHHTRAAGPLAAVGIRR